jgi:hypothetical protein
MTRIGSFDLQADPVSGLDQDQLLIVAVAVLLEGSRGYGP